MRNIVYTFFFFLSTITLLSAQRNMPLSFSMGLVKMDYLPSDQLSIAPITDNAINFNIGIQIPVYKFVYAKANWGYFEHFESTLALTTRFEGENVINATYTDHFKNTQNYFSIGVGAKHGKTGLYGDISCGANFTNYQSYYGGGRELYWIGAEPHYISYETPLLKDTYFHISTDIGWGMSFGKEQRLGATVFLKYFKTVATTNIGHYLDQKFISYNLGLSYYLN